ncbi:MAG: FAD-dependent oxidoreductase, partial [Mangrovicoccus sp.]
MTAQTQSRRRFLLGCATGAVAMGTAGLVASRTEAARFAIIGAGPAGVSAAHALRQAHPNALIQIIERDPSRLSRTAAPQTAFAQPGLGLTAGDLDAAGIELVIDDVTAIDWDAGRVELFSRRQVIADQILLAPGVAAREEAIEGLTPRSRHLWPAAWGSQAEARRLSAQLAALEPGAHMVLRLPKGFDYAPEIIAHRAETLLRHSPNSKLTVLDGGLHSAAAPLVATRLAPRLSWVQDVTIHKIEPDRGMIDSSAGNLRADLVNFVPQLGAAKLAQATG